MANYSKFIYSPSLATLASGATDLIEVQDGNYVMTKAAEDKFIVVGENDNASNTDKYFIAHGILFDGNNTWRPVSVDGNSIGTSALNIIGGDGVKLTSSNGTITINLDSSISSETLFNSIMVNGATTNASETFKGLNFAEATTGEGDTTTKGAVSIVANEDGTISFDVKTDYTPNAQTKSYAVSKDAEGNLFVDVPWVDTNTTYSLVESGEGNIVVSMKVDEDDATKFVATYANIWDLKVGSAENAKSLADELTSIHNDIASTNSLASSGMYYQGPASSVVDLSSTPKTGYMYKAISTFEIVPDPTKADEKVSVKHGDAIVARIVEGNTYWDVIPSADDASFGTIKIGDSTLNASTATDTLNISSSACITAEISGESLVFSHVQHASAAGSFGSDIVKSEDEGVADGTVIKIPTLTVDAYGHVTATSEFELDLDKFGDKLTFKGDNYISVKRNESDNNEIDFALTALPNFVSAYSVASDTKKETNTVKFSRSFEMNDEGEVDIHWTVIA